MVHLISDKPTDTSENWQEKVTECAQQYSFVIEERFVGSKMRAEQFLPKPATQEQLAECTAIFIDYLIGTMVAILCNGKAAPIDYEDDVVNIVRDKFDRLRNIHGEGETI